MQALRSLTVANIKSFVRDRQALFWTLAFPLIFIFLFGAIFSGGSNKTKIGWADGDGTPASAALRQVFVSVPVVELVEGTKDEMLAKFQHGDVAGVVVVEPGYGATVAAAQAGSGPPALVTVYTDPSQSSTAGAVQGLVAGILAQANLGTRPLAIVPNLQDLKTQDLNAVSYLVPSILGMSLMQLGIFSALPLVADRQKLILKRLSATPLRRWQLIGSNIIMRLLIGARPDDDHRRDRRAGVQREDHRQPPGRGRPVAARRRDVHLARLRRRLVRQDRGFGQRDGQRDPVPADVPVGHVLPDRR